MDPRALYKKDNFSRLCVNAGVLDDFNESLEKDITKALSRLASIDSRRFLGFAIRVLENLDEIDKIDFTRDIYLYSQTTKSLQEFKTLVEEIEKRINGNVVFKSYDTICRSVANRIPQIRQFASRHELILFVCGSKSSNGKILFAECHDANPNSHMISNENEIDPSWLEGKHSIGICGATSTPRWLMNQVKNFVEKNTK